MPRQQYQLQLDRLREDVLAMSEQVLERFESAVIAIETHDQPLGHELVASDHEINELYLRLEQDCIDLLALQQPVATDLRFVTASFKIITDLERIADLAVNLGEYAMATGAPLTPTFELEPISSLAASLVTEAMEAYATDDADASRSIASRDDELDRRCRQASERIVRALIATDRVGTTDEDLQRDLEAVSRSLLSIRDIERVGDHAVNICARTVYMVDNDDELIF